MISDYICKISNDNYLVWLKNSNKYIVVDSKLLKLINDKPKFSENIFLNKISQSLNINLSKSKDIYINNMKSNPNIKVEVLTPDFNGSVNLLKNVIDAGPHVMNHNIETVRRVFKKVRPKGNYDLSLNFLSDSKKIKPDLPTKSGMMVGLGETKDEVIETMKDLRDHQCDLLTIGQYLRPSKKHHPIIKFYNPREFTEFQNIGLDMGFSHVAAGPLVRSSYHADEQHNAAVEKLINQIKS